jgi:DNA polymerase I-like protein with 3'-5' exonuclease and polymerase domains
MELILDVENTTTVIEFEDGKEKRDFTPFRSSNKLVCVGTFAPKLNLEHCFFFNHKDLSPNWVAQYTKDELQHQLDNCTLLVGHNLKHDLTWIKESGFKLPKGIRFWDTSIASYVLAKGQVHSYGRFKLEFLAERFDLPRKKLDLIQKYYDDNIPMDEIPIEVVKEYNLGDLATTHALRQYQLDQLAKPENIGLLATIEMMNEFMHVLQKWQATGIKIDLVELERVGAEYELEQTALIDKLTKIARVQLGDTPFNLNSGEDKSVLLYSRRIKDKKEWKRVFNIGTDEKGKELRRPKLNKAEFTAKVRELTNVEYRTVARQCPACVGTGRYLATKKDGTVGKAVRICRSCEGVGIIYDKSARIAGFKFSPGTVRDCGVNGFVTEADKLDELLLSNPTDTAKEFLEGLIRLNQVNTYLSTFVGGIRRATHKNTSILYTNFNQIITATGRLSSSDPNFQNQPRGKTFPVKKAIISRFPGGKIFEADYAQLEFRCAGALSHDKQILSDVINKVDIHAFTRDTLNKADGGNRDRQDAKPETFKPVYGGTWGTPTQMAYYAAFKAKYSGLTKWQDQTSEYVLRNGFYVLPTGRQYRWLGVKREWDGRVSFFTQIVNYPVQGFATADIVPIACILIDEAFTRLGLKSLPFLTVHDSIAVDVYPGEEDVVKNTVVDCMLDVKRELLRRYDYNLTIPLEVEGKLGYNWLELEKVISKSHDYIVPKEIKKNEFTNDPIPF